MANDGVNNDQILRTETLPSFRVNAIIAEYLNELAKTGFYGNKATDVAKALLTDAVMQLVQSGQIEPIKCADRHRVEKGAKPDKSDDES